MIEVCNGERNFIAVNPALIYVIADIYGGVK